MHNASSERASLTACAGEMSAKTGEEQHDPDLSDISIVVLSFNRKETLQENLPDLTRLAEETGCELIVVDNASTDGSAEMIRRCLGRKSEVPLITNESNKGVAGGRNAGWRKATRKFILNLDDDISIAAPDVDRMAQVLRTSPEVGIVGPTIVDRGAGHVQYGYGPNRLELANFQGACHMIRRDLALRVGLNDERCSFGAEEIDLSIRVRAAGYSVIYTPAATALHDHKTRDWREARSRRERCAYNFIRVFYKHFPLTSAVPFSLRCLTSHVVSASSTFGARFGMKIAWVGLLGCVHGMKDSKVVPAHVVRFYRDPELRPEFGNRPLWRKLVDKHMRKKIKASSPATATRSSTAARDR